MGTEYWMRFCICTNVHELKSNRALTKCVGDLPSLQWSKSCYFTVGSYVLNLPSGLIMQLKNCYYVPVMRRNIIFVSCLDTFVFSFIIKDNCCSII